MPNVAKVLKEEISRISRKEAKAAVAPIRRPSVRHRKDIANLKRRVAALEKESQRLVALLKRVQSAAPALAAAPEAEGKARITAKGMRSLRRKLGLSQADFAKLIGITTPAVSHWEQRQGALRVRPATRKAILSIRGLGAREARRRLVEMKPAKAASKRRKARRTRK